MIHMKIKNYEKDMMMFLMELWVKLKKIDDDWLEYAKCYMKIKFSSDDNLPLNKPLQF